MLYNVTDGKAALSKRIQSGGKLKKRGVITPFEDVEIMRQVKLFFIDIRLIARHKRVITDIIPQERVKKASAYLREKDTLLSLGAAYLMTMFIGEWYTDKKGKPRSEHTYFSVSHSGDLVGIAISDFGETGLDIEFSAEKKASLVDYCLSEDEKAVYRHGGEFLKFFVAKESLSKAEGAGLGGNVKVIPAIPFDGEVEYLGKTYFRHSFERKGYLVSVTCEGEDFELVAEDVKAI